MRGATLVLTLLVALAAPATAADDRTDGILDDVPRPDVGAALAAASAATSTAAAATGDAVAASASAVASAFAAIGRAAASLGAAVADAAGATGAALVAFALGAVDALVAGGRFAADHPQETAVVAGATAGAGAFAGLALWLKRLGVLAALPLYSRLAPEDVLTNKARQEAYAFIQAHPGAHPRQIAAAVGIGWGTVVYHLGRLEERGLVASVKRGTMKCYFATGSTPVAERGAVAALKHPTAQAIADFVRAHPQASQKDVGAALGLSAALVSWHVGRLEQAGVLTKARHGKGTVLALALA